MSSIYLYSSSGCNTECVDQMQARLRENDIDPSRIVPITDLSYLNRVLENRQAILIIPGGNFLCIQEELEKSVSKIREKVDGGWNYLGFCAGGFFGADRWVANEYKFDAGEFYKFLKLLPVIAQTPVYPIIKKHCQGGSNNRVVRITTKDENMFYSFWSEGCIFDPRGSVTEEACYDELDSKPIAVASSYFGRGKVVLSGIHPEVNFRQVDSSLFSKYLSLKEEYESLVARNNFLRKIFNFVDILD